MTLKKKLVIRKPTEDEIDTISRKLSIIYSKPKYNRVKARLMANEMLRLLKPNFSYRVLSELTGIPESVLCRYVRGSIIPSFEQALKILASLSLSVDINSLLHELVEREKSSIIDLSRVLKDPYIIRLLTILLMIELAGNKIDKIVATSFSVLPLATMLGLELNCPIVLVKRRPYPGFQYYSAIVVRTPRETESLYIDRDLLSRRDNVLVLADVVYTGKTLSAVLDMVMRSRAKISKIVVLLALGDAWKASLLRRFDIQIMSYIEYPL